MTKVAILTGPSNGGAPTYRAVAGERQSVGRTAGEALDALVTQLPEGEAGTIVVVLVQPPRAYVSPAMLDTLVRESPIPPAANQGPPSPPFELHNS